MTVCCPGPSSRVTTACIQQLVLIILLGWLSVVQAHLHEVQPHVYNNWYLLFFLDDCCPGPSSRVTTLCIQQLVLTILLRWLSVVQANHNELQPYIYNNWYFLFFLDDCLLSWMDWSFQSIQDNSQSSKKNNKYQIPYTYDCTSWWWA